MLPLTLTLATGSVVANGTLIALARRMKSPLREAHLIWMAATGTALSTTSIVFESPALSLGSPAVYGIRRACEAQATLSLWLGMCYLTCCVFQVRACFRDTYYTYCPARSAHP